MCIGVTYTYIYTRGVNASVRMCVGGIGSVYVRECGFIIESKE